jgi:thioredoxin-related protein
MDNIKKLNMKNTEELNAYQLSNLIEKESIKLNILVCDKGTNRFCDRLKKILSSIKSCQDDIHSLNERLKDFNN